MCSYLVEGGPGEQISLYDEELSGVVLLHEITVEVVLEVFAQEFKLLSYLEAESCHFL